MTHEPVQTVPGQEWLDGQILLLDKPLHWTSFQLVKKVRVVLERMYGFRKLKVGHAGTLDPLATGLLIIGTGAATRKLESHQSEDKEYVATIRVGATTRSFDLETEIDQEFPFDHITEAQINRVLRSWIGEQEQMPPLFSAKKIKGVRAYEYARSGTKKQLTAKTIRLNELEMLQCNIPDLVIRIACTKGTYIRSFAQDLGHELQSGAHLIALRRIRSGSFSIQDAESVEQFEKRILNRNKS